MFLLRKKHPEKLKNIIKNFPQSKLVHSIMRHVSETTRVDLETLYREIGWPLYKAYGHAHDGFKAMVSSTDDAGVDAVFARVSQEAHGGSPIACLSAAVRDQLVKNVRRRLTPQPLKCRADVELTCFAFDGVLRIQEAMRAAEAASTEVAPIRMKLVAPPLYVLTTQTLDKQAGIEALTAACEACAASASASGGRCVVREPPRAVSERDDRLLTDHLLALESANKEVAGDDDVSGSDDEGMGDLPE